jgi:uncharacterized protein (DUF4415 family)
MTTPRRPTDPMAAAQAAFKPIKKPLQPAPKTATLPNARELVSLRIDRNVLEYFQQSGPGWQDRINEALQQIAREGSTDDPGKRPDELNASNDG